MAESASTDQKRQKSLYKGVFRCGKKFKAQIQTNGVQNYLGLFDSEVEAAKAYDNHARTYLGSRAKTNFKYDAPIKTLVQPRPVMSVDEQVKHIRNKPVRNAKRVYAGIKVRCHSFTDFNPEAASAPVSFPPVAATEAKVEEVDQDEEQCAEIILKDDLFIVTDASDDESESPKKRRRSTGNVTPKELFSCASATNASTMRLSACSRLSARLSASSMRLSASNLKRLHKVEMDEDGNAIGYDFDAFFENCDLSEYDWRDQMWALTESLSFDATIDDGKSYLLPPPPPLGAQLAAAGGKDV